jgi:hypothetical protein
LVANFGASEVLCQEGLLSHCHSDVHQSCLRTVEPAQNRGRCCHTVARSRTTRQACAKNLFIPLGPSVKESFLVTLYIAALPWQPRLAISLRNSAQRGSEPASRPTSQAASQPVSQVASQPAGQPASQHKASAFDWPPGSGGRCPARPDNTSRPLPDHGGR